MTIPKYTDRAHLKAMDPRCDTLTVLNMAARRRPGHRYADMNACRTLDGDLNVHWPEGPNLNFYDWIWTGKRNRYGREIRRQMSGTEKRRNVAKWKTEDALKWRRGPRGGPKPKTVAQRNKQAKRRLVRICWEIKTRDYGDNPEYAKRFVSSINATGWRAYYMALVTLRNWGPKLRAFHNAGGETALLAHGAKKPANLSYWRPSIDVIWGRWR